MRIVEVTYGRALILSPRKLWWLGKVYSPKSVGGLNLINLHSWNKAAIAKHCWDLEHKQDKLWIKWVHSYYIKRTPFQEVIISQQACWMVKKILEARQVYSQFQPIVLQNKSMIRQLYFHLFRPQQRVPWKCLMFQNFARPKAVFTMWLQLQNRLNTTDRLKKWGLDIELKCVLCQLHFEFRDHMYTSCPYSQQVWSKLLQWIQFVQAPYNNWSQYVLGIIDAAKGKTPTAQIFKLVYTEYVYAIWIERNHRIFEKDSRTWESLAREIAYICCVRAS
uniref:Tn7 reverse transcriptase n=2 Tax=Solanum tuberosum TaxID=4113 RepID=M1BZI3_SOLTU